MSLLQDGGGDYNGKEQFMSSSATLTVNVIDAQDTPPSFIGTPYFGYVYEISEEVNTRHFCLTFSFRISVFITIRYNFYIFMLSLKLHYKVSFRAMCIFLYFFCVYFEQYLFHCEMQPLCKMYVCFFVFFVFMFTKIKP